MKLLFALSSLSVATFAAPVWTPPFVTGFRKLHPQAPRAAEEVEEEKSVVVAEGAVASESAVVLPAEGVAEEEHCQDYRRLQICFAQDVTPSFAPLLGNLKGNYTQLVNDLEALYPGSEFALGEFRDHAIKARPFRLQTSMTDAASFVSMIDDVYGGRPAMSDSTPRDSGPASYDDELAGEAALDGAYFCWRDGGFSHIESEHVLKMVVIVTDALPRLPFWDLSRDQEQLFSVARKTFGGDFTWTPWNPQQTYQETRWADWISPEQLSQQIERNPVELYAAVANDFEGHNPRAGWMDAFRRMGVPSSHYLELKNGLANIRTPVLRAIDRLTCQRPYVILNASEQEEADKRLMSVKAEAADSEILMEEEVLKEEAVLEEPVPSAEEPVAELVREEAAAEHHEHDHDYDQVHYDDHDIDHHDIHHHHHHDVVVMEPVKTTTTTPCPPSTIKATPRPTTTTTKKVTTTTTTPCPSTTTTTRKTTTTTTTPCPPTTTATRKTTTTSTTTKKPITTTTTTPCPPTTTTTPAPVHQKPWGHTHAGHTHVQQPMTHKHHAPTTPVWEPTDQCRCSCECKTQLDVIEASVEV